jgi:hypothetical protein
MGKRSRQREAPQTAKAKGHTRKQRLRDQANVATGLAEKQIRERPRAPWDPFPLAELSIFVGILLAIAAAIIGGPMGKGLFAAGVVLACIGGLDTALREHFAGYRTHAGLLAGLVAVLVLFFSSAVLKAPPAIAAGVAIVLFGLLFTTLRSSFIRKSGGRGVL